MESVEATLVSIRYRSPDSQWIIATMKGKDGKSFIAAGDIPLDSTESVELFGEWVDDKKYGRQFKTDSYVGIQPSDNNGVIQYLLAAGKIQGLGKSDIDRLLKVERLSSYLNGDQLSISNQLGLSTAVADDIHRVWNKGREKRTLSLFLYKSNISPSWGSRILEQWSVQEAIDNITNNPYSLTEIPGIGFTRADVIARATGLAYNVELRTRAAALQALKDYTEEGSTFAHEAEVEETAAKLLKAKKVAVTPRQKISEAIQYLIDNGKIITETLTNEFSTIRLLYLPEVYEAEKELAELIVERLQTKIEPINVDKHIEELQRNGKIRYSDEQLAAIRGVFSNNTSVITGGPGSGKTTSIRAISELGNEYKLAMRYTASTGRAAKRLEEVTGRPATTIHRLLCWTREGFLKNRESQIQQDIFIVDEASMLDISLARSLLSAIRPSARLVLVGDENQLPSITAGSTLTDLSQVRSIPKYNLSTTFRQEHQSLITRNAELINSGEMPRFPETKGVKEDSYAMWIPRNKSDSGGKDDAEWVHKIVPKLVAEYIPSKYPDITPKDIQVLVPMRKGTIGADALNKSLQAVLNPNGEPVDNGFRVGDRVMQIVNNYETEIYNGDIGYVIPSENNGQSGRIFVDFSGQHRLVDCSELQQAYIQTIHKAQGSEYKATVVVMGFQHWPMLSRNLLYTAATRAKQLGIFVTSKGVLSRAVKHCPVDTRKSYLKHRINNLMKDHKSICKIV